MTLADFPTLAFAEEIHCPGDRAADDLRRARQLAERTAESLREATAAHKEAITALRAAETLALLRGA